MGTVTINDPALAEMRERLHCVRRVRVPWRDVFEVLIKNMSGKCKLVLESPQIPIGCEVVSVDHAPYERCFVFTIYHPLFTPVPDGELIPLLADRCYYEIRDITVDQQIEGFTRTESTNSDGKLVVIYTES